MTQLELCLMTATALSAAGEARIRYERWHNKRQ